MGNNFEWNGHADFLEVLPKKGDTQVVVYSANRDKVSHMSESMGWHIGSEDQIVSSGLTAQEANQFCEKMNEELRLARENK